MHFQVLQPRRPGCLLAPQVAVAALPTWLLPEELVPAASSHWRSKTGPAKGKGWESRLAAVGTVRTPGPIALAEHQFCVLIAAQCSRVVLCLYLAVLRHCKFLHGYLSCVSESMLYLDGQRHFNSMSASQTMKKDYLLKPQGKPHLLETSLPSA